MIYIILIITRDVIFEYLLCARPQALGVGGVWLRSLGLVWIPALRLTTSPTEAGSCDPLSWSVMG